MPSALVVLRGKPGHERARQDRRPWRAHGAGRAVRAVSTGMLALAVVLAALVGIIAMEVRAGGIRPLLTPIAATHPGGLARAPGAGGAADALSAQEVATMLARPLFTPDRRPAEAGGDATTGLARLTGVVVTAAGKTAIFAGSVDGRPLVVPEGARIGQYVVASIEADAVTIIGPDGRRVLHPTFDPNQPAVQSSVPSPAAPQPSRPPAAR